MGPLRRLPPPPPHTHTEHLRAFSWLAHGTAGAYDSIEGTDHVFRGCRVPFEARSMAELRTKVMAGRFKPITPGKYSADLINLMGQLLQVNPQRRPEVSKILASSVVQKHAAGGSHKAAPAEPSSKGNVLQTIKVTQQRACFRCTLSQNVCCESSCLVLPCLTVFCTQCASYVVFPPTLHCPLVAIWSRYEEQWPVKLLVWSQIPADLRLLQARLPQAEYGDAEGRSEQIQAHKSPNS